MISLRDSFVIGAKDTGVIDASLVLSFPKETQIESMIIAGGRRRITRKEM